MVKQRTARFFCVILFLALLITGGRAGLPGQESLREQRVVTGMIIEQNGTGSQKKLTAGRDSTVIGECREFLDSLKGNDGSPAGGFTVAVVFSDKTIDTYFVGREDEEAYLYFSTLFEHMIKML